MMSDKVFLKNLRVQAILGIYPQERVTPQTVLISAWVESDTRRAAKSDSIEDCLDYEQLAKRLKAHTQNARRQTVEALAEELAQLCLATPGARAVTLRVEKPEACPEAESVGVEIFRRKPKPADGD
ncbi:MAG: hypothetical protein OHK0031_05550 [Anaerolineales bacterium]